MDIIDLAANTFLFNFTRPEEPKRTLHEAPWNVIGHLVVLHPWNPSKAINEMAYEHSPYWVKAHGVLLEMFSSE